jgi:uncharacterized membrane protein
MDRGESLARVGALVGGCTLVLTAAFVGVVALVSGLSPGLNTRLPVYVLVMAGSFVGTLLVVERRRRDGRQIIVTATGVGTAVFVLVALAGEGVSYAAANPAEVFDPTLILYLLAAGLIGTGLGYWGVRHWREFTGGGAEGL